MRKIGKENGLDAFRLPAAFLVVAIHTSPLESVSADADLFLTRILARIAVPFFLMVSGQYVQWNFHRSFLCKGDRSGTTVAHFLKKTAILYGIAILLYLPVGIYAGQYQGLDVASLVRMVFFDGTFYHLWYFPACIIGVLLLCLIGRIFTFRGILAVSAVLYVVGLGGDSYYGLISSVSWLKAAYDAIFSFSSYTRNGLFLAPLFLALGAAAGRKKKPLSARSCGLGFAISLLAMTVEGFVLHRLELCRHDSMYIALPFCAYFGYCWLLTMQCRSDRRLRTVAAWIYILHPAVIVLVRGVAKAVGLTELLVENSLIHYVTVCILSFLSAMAAAAAAMSIERICKGNTYPTGRAWIEISRDALRQNVNALRAGLPESCELMPAVKADAYGHGAVLVARELQGMGVRHFCVASVQEGVELRKCGIRGKILVLGYTHPEQFGLLRRYRLTQTVIDLAYAKQLNGYGRKLSVHIAVDTGMHRLGERSESIESLSIIYRMKNLSVEGIFTHLCADDVDLPQAKDFTRRQAEEFYHVVTQLRKQGFPCPKIHLSASYGILNYPELSEDYVRVGIALYGVFGTGEDTENSRIPLSPVMSLKARVVSVKRIYEGETVGYGMAYTAREERTVAVLSIGYADGLPRALSNGVGEVLLHGKRAPIIGKICMDQTMVDVSEISEVRAGDTAVIIGRSDGEEITVCDIAEKTGTITNEVLSRMGKRLERVYG